MSNFRLFPLGLSSGDSFKRTVRISIFEGAFSQVFVTLSFIGSVFISKYALYLGAAPIHLAMLAAIAQLAQVFHLAGVVYSRRIVHRRAPCVWLAVAGRLWMVFVGALLPRAGTDWAIWAFLGMMLASSGLLAMSSNIWVAWVNDLTPQRIRGRFFSLRSQFHLAVGLVTGYLCSLLVDAFTAGEGSMLRGVTEALGVGWFFVPRLEGAGLAAVITSGGLLGLLGLYFLARQPERVNTPDHRSIAEIVAEPFRSRNFRRLLVFNVWWMLALGVGSPFWQPFMIQTLRMSTLEITMYSAISSLAMLLFVRQWGRFIDRYGNKPALMIAVAMGAVNPAIWCFVSPQSYWLLWFEAASSGVMWGAMGVIGVNFVLSLAPKGRAQSYFAVYSAVSGLCMMLTSILSGRFFPPPLTILGRALTPEQVLFALTAVLRLTAQIPLRWIEEPRAKPLRNALGRVFTSGFMQSRGLMLKVFRIRL